MNPSPRTARPGAARAHSRSRGSRATARWLVRFGYDGSDFAGWARQPGLRTVEGEIRAGLLRTGLAPPSGSRSLDVASRTDRGVHARGNALALETSLGGIALLRALNGFAPDIFFTDARPVPKEFRVRAAVERRYRYFEPAKPGTEKAWTTALQMFVGRVDVRSFGRGLGADHPVWRVVDATEVHREGPVLVLEIRARSYVWGMVRKIVAAARAVVAGELPPTTLRAALEGQRRLTLPLAEPERLVLWDVRYEDPWLYSYRRPTRRQQERAAAVREGSLVRPVVAEHLWRSATGAEPATDVGTK